MSSRGRTTRVLVGVYDGGLSGINTYAEQVAVAGAVAGHDVTLVATTPALAAQLRSRLADTGIRVLDLGLNPPSRSAAMAYRLWPGLDVHRLARGLQQTLSRLHERFPVAHLNHPRLSTVARAGADRVYVGAWFYPHALLPRVVETWRHTGGHVPKRLVLAAKAISYYRNDAIGYRDSDYAVAPTALLARHLQGQGIASVICPPPIRVLARSDRDTRDVPPRRDSERGEGHHRLLICSGDLSHPRKNVSAAIRAMRFLPATSRPLVLEIIGRNAAALRRDVDRLPRTVRVSFTGPLPPAEVQARMRRADALLLPSLFEEWGYVAVEALLCGTPVVTFPVYPFADMLAPGFGAQANACTDEAFADAIQHVLQHGRPAHLAAAANARFGVEPIGHRLTDIWSSA